VLDLGLGSPFYSKAQVEEVQKFQNSQGTWRAYLSRPMEDEARMGPGASAGGVSQGGSHRRGGLVLGAPLLPDGTPGNFYSARTSCMEHGKSDCFSDCSGLHHLQS
jgi:hypothetical protein